MAGSLASIFGKGGDGPPPKDDAARDDNEDEDQPGDEKLPPDFEAAYDDYEANPTAMTFWRAVEACAEHHGGPGLAIVIGKGKR